MEENTTANLDLEFKRYLKLLRPYLCQLLDQDVIQICDAWIKKLSGCSEQEKALRNKYLFILCLQLARGTLEGPFLNEPPPELSPVIEDLTSDESMTDPELFADLDPLNTEVLFNRKEMVPSETEYLSYDEKHGDSVIDSEKSVQKVKKESVCQQCSSYNCTEVGNSCALQTEEHYEVRANNLVKRLREIKMQNFLLQKELNALKEESKDRTQSFMDNYIVKVDNSTSTCMSFEGSATKINSLKYRLQEVNDTRNILLDRISSLKNQLENFEELKNNEIDDIRAKHKLEIIKIKTTIKEETREIYENKLEEQRLNFENLIKETKNKALLEINELRLAKDEIMQEKLNTMKTKENEISLLKSQLEEQKSSLHSLLNKIMEKSNDESSNDSVKYKAQLLEKRLNKMEKSKFKCAKYYEIKLAQLQRDKHLSECSLHLQLVKQRAQIFTELSDENQSELSTSLDKLENKYKEIVANVQATAIQRRMQDQSALASILRAACDNDFQGSTRNICNQNQTYETEISSLIRGNKVGNVFTSNKSFGEDSLVTGYCLNGERMGELFERVYIPQRDSSNAK